MNFGEFAGNVYHALEAAGELTLANLAKETSLKKEEAAAGLGWLAKEDKIETFQKGRSVIFKLK